MDFIINGFSSTFKTTDPSGKKMVFQNRYASCFIITFSGKIRFSFDGGCVVSDKNNAVFLPEGLTYTNECIEKAESIVFNFHITDKTALPATLRTVAEDFANERYCSIKEAEISFHPLKNAKILSELYSLAYVLYSPDTGLSGSDAILQKAMAYMNKNYNNPKLTAAAIAAHCFISEIYLRKIFTQKKNTTPHRVLTDIRMKKAYSYDLEKRPVKEIALNVGYSDVYQFSRAYKKHFGHPPSKTF